MHVLVLVFVLFVNSFCKFLNVDAPCGNKLYLLTRLASLNKFLHRYIQHIHTYCRFLLDPWCRAISSVCRKSSIKDKAAPRDNMQTRAHEGQSGRYGKSRGISVWDTFVVEWSREMAGQLCNWTIGSNGNCRENGPRVNMYGTSPVRIRRPRPSVEKHDLHRIIRASVWILRLTNNC